MLNYLYFILPNKFYKVETIREYDEEYYTFLITIIPKFRLNIEFRDKELTMYDILKKLNLEDYKNFKIYESLFRDEFISLDEIEELEF